MECLRILLLLLALITIGCRPDGGQTVPPPPESRADVAKTIQQPQSEAEVPTTEPAYTYYPLKVGERTIAIQIALTDDERRVGLMNRPSMEPNDGMLFVFQDVRPRRFWMKNTLIPLDIAYIQPDGTIAEIHQMQPLDETGMPSRSRSIQFALEMNEGWFEKNGVDSGQRIDINQVTEAMTGRGFSPSDFGINSTAIPNKRSY